MEIQGQLNEVERRLITGLVQKPRVTVQVGTWLGGGSTLHSLRAAKRHLFWQTCHPAEIAASHLPASVCGFALRLLPKKFSRHLSDGKN
jgi:hypothetical protein